jgi:photosynthetic reaction center H subunit
VDKAEYVLRYLEAEVPTGPTTSRRILVPANFIRYDAGRRKAHVKALFAKHFANVPGLRNPDQVTLLEEDKIMGYFGGGLLYASPQRLEPVL